MQNEEVNEGFQINIDIVGFLAASLVQSPKKIKPQRNFQIINNSGIVKDKIRYQESVRIKWHSPEIKNTV